jgi:hypothetical protein
LTTVTFTLEARSTPFHDELGLFLVDDSSGRIGKLKPGDRGYTAAALKRRQIVFASNQVAGATTALQLPGSRYFGTYLIQDGTSARFLARNPHNLCTNTPKAFFSFPAANPFHSTQVIPVGPDLSGWEDQIHERKRDFQDEVVRITVDDQPPVVTILTPPESLLTRTNTTVSGTVTDDLSGVKTLLGQVDTGSPFNVVFDAAGQFHFDTTLPTNGSADGHHLVTLQATDNVGNVSGPATVSFVLDTTPPTLSQAVPGPLPGSAGQTGSDPQIAGRVTDAIAGVKQLEARVDNGPYMNVPFDAEGNYSFKPQLPLDGSADGPHAVYYRAIDKAGNALNDLPGPTFSLDTCGFVNGLADWKSDQTGGTNTGQGTVTLDTSGKENSVLLSEGDSFRVALERTFVVPAGASSLEFEYANLSFDTSSLGTIKDAFEGSLVDPSGQSLVHTIGAGRDAFFNITEWQGAALGSETTISAQTVTLDLSGVSAGTTATLILRLVNNDTDHNTSVGITCVRIPSGSVSLTSSISSTMTASGMAMTSGASPVVSADVTAAAPAPAPSGGVLARRSVLIFATTSQPASPTVTLEVGYADSLRPSPFFPDPWNG